MTRQVKVGHRVYEIAFVTNGDIEADGHWGECDKRRGIIRVASNGRPRDAQAETLVHEILHALIEDTGREWDDDEEELIVSRLSPRLTAFVRDNATLVGELLQMLA